MNRTRKPETSIRNQRGFTFLEIMLVVVIIGVLASIVALSLRGRSKEAKINATEAEMEIIGTALEQYEIENGMYPTTEQGLDALLRKPATSPEPKNWKSPYLTKSQELDDPWGNPYQYTQPGRNNTDGFDLKSNGPDGVEGGEDDITNWK
jgi:general secretion pathway protein G